MHRRALLGGIAATFVAARAAQAQRAERAARVSIYAREPTWHAAITDVLRERGWVEGRNVTFTAYVAEGADEHIAEHLVAAPPDVMVLGGPIRVRAAMRATSTVPIIGLDLESDPVASGFVRTLARPGGNVSGVWMDLPEIAGKQIQFLRETVPSLSRLGVLRDDRIGELQFQEVQAVCRRTGTTVHAVPIRAEAEIDRAVKHLAAERPQAVLVLTAPVISAGLSRIGALLLAERVPSISPFSTFPRVGGLLAYGPDFPTMWRQVAHYVDRVLKGARVGDLPVERPSKFSLIVSRQTARRIGLELPSSLVLRADEVIS